MSKITFLMTVHNAEAFLKDAIESVLNQTEKDISLYIRNNASEDQSGQIIEAYANSDSRILVLENKENYKTDDGYTVKDREWWPAFDGEYVAIIDHDDILDKDFSKEMYNAAKKSDADMVISGCKFFEDKTGRFLGNRLPPDISTKDMKKLADSFPQLYGSLRTVWGKIYRTTFYEQFFLYARQRPEGLKLSTDTWYVLRYLENCNSLVCINRPLYYYRMRKDSGFNAQIVSKTRIDEADILLECGIQCIHKLGISTDDNLYFLKRVHWGHMHDLLNLLIKSSTMSIEDKLDYIQDILRNRQLHIHLKNAHTGFFSEVLSDINDCLSHIVPDLKKADSHLWKYYIIRLYESYIMQQTSQQGIHYTILLGALLDKENIYHFGFHLVKHPMYSHLSIAEAYYAHQSSTLQEGLLNDRHKFVKTMEEHFDTNLLLQMQDKLVQAAESENYGLASELLEELSGLNALDEYVLYYRLFLSCAIGETNFACKLSYTASSIWEESSEIAELCTYIRELPSEGNSKYLFNQEYLNISPDVFDDFDIFCDAIRKYTLQSLLNLSFAEHCRQKLCNSTSEIYQIDSSVAMTYTKQTYIGCFLSMEQGGATVYDAIKDMKRNINYYQEVYRSLCDQQSRDTLLDIMLFRFYGDLKYLARCKSEETQYYLPYLLPQHDEAVFVDCGAFDGNTVLEYISVYGQDYKKIYAYEPMPQNYENVCKTLEKLPSVEVLNKGVSSKSGVMRFTSHLPNAANRLNSNGRISVPIGTLDQDISEAVSFIKMDIEGAEQQAIEGCKNHIRNDAPELAICVYHLVNDLWKIPKQLMEINPNQKLYLRYHMDGSLPEEMVLYASPVKDLKV